MADQVRIVETRFIPTDKTSGALDNIATEAKRADRQLDEMAKTSQRATKAVKGTGGAMPSKEAAREAMKAERAALKAKHEEERKAAKAEREETKRRRAGGEEGMALAAERDKFALSKQEMLLRRARQRDTRMEMQQDKVLHQASSAGLMMMMGEENKYVSKLMRSAGAMEMMGVTLAAVGGKTGAFGERLTRVSGKAMALGGALDLGMSMGDKWVEGFEALDNWIAGMRGAESMFGDIWGEGHQRQLEEANKEYAEALGFVSAKHYEEANEEIGRANHEKKLARAISEQKTLLKALPTDKTGKAMEEFDRSLLEAAKRGQQLDVGMKELLEGLREAAAHTAVTKEAQANRKAALEDAAKQQVVAEGIAALPDDATVEMKRAHAAQVREAVESAIRLTGAEGEEVDQLQELVSARIEAHDSIEGAAAAHKEEAVASLNMHRALTEAEKHLKEIPASMIRLKDGAEHIADKEFEIAKAAGMKFGITEPAKIEKLAKEIHGKVERRIFDFPGSRFDILQKFEEGFDPDRVATAMAGSFADLGERQVSSHFGLSGVFGVPG